MNYKIGDIYESSAYVWEVVDYDKLKCLQPKSPPNTFKVGDIFDCSRIDMYIKDGYFKLAKETRVLNILKQIDDNDRADNSPSW